MGRPRKKQSLELQSIRVNRPTEKVDSRDEITVETSNGESEKLRKLKIPEGWLYILETYYEPGPHIGRNSKAIISTAMTFVPDNNLLS
tara:strand:+ start:1780 stop:2043 length:264 start_codon:yes stop_codon:yes gene_type:complete